MTAIEIIATFKISLYFKDGYVHICPEGCAPTRYSWEESPNNPAERLERLIETWERSAIYYELERQRREAPQ